MARTVLLDTGFVVATLNAKDPDHPRCVECLGSLRARFVTVEGVLVEASHLLRKLPSPTALVIEFALRLKCELHAATPERLVRARHFVEANAKLKLDLVDALLCVAAEELDLSEVLTLDRRDFTAVRLAGNRRFQVLPGP